MFIEPKQGAADKYEGKQSPELTAFKIDIVKSLGETSQTDIYASIVTSAEFEWLEDPFCDIETFGRLREAETNGITDSTDQEDDFVYTGYVDMGNNKMAIVNGMEYKVGEDMKLEAGTFFLENIYPSKVVIGNRSSGMLLDVPLKKIENFNHDIH